MRAARMKARTAAAQARIAEAKGPSKRSQRRAIDQDKQLSWQQAVEVQRQRLNGKKSRGAVKP